MRDTLNGIIAEIILVGLWIKSMGPQSKLFHLCHSVDGKILSQSTVELVAFEQE